jgi:hypothetical protein
MIRKNYPGLVGRIAEVRVYAVIDNIHPGDIHP